MIPDPNTATFFDGSVHKQMDLLNVEQICKK